LGAPIVAALEQAAEADRTLARPNAKAAAVVAAKDAPGGRIVVGSLPDMTDDVDDARSVAEVTALAVARAVDAGARMPLLHVVGPYLPRSAHALDGAALAALGTRWPPLEAREAGKAPARAERVGVLGLTPERAEHLQRLAAARSLTRDITGTEPERMAPRRA